MLHKGGVELASFAGLPLFFGSVAFSFEWTAVVLPLENKMRQPEHATRVLVIAMTTVITLNLVFGVLGYLAFGTNTAASITLNLISESNVEKM